MPLADPGVWNLTIYAGATFSRRATPSGTPWNLTGYNARAQLRETYPSADPVVTLGTAAGTATITLGGTAGWVQVDMDATTTAYLGSVYDQATKTVVWDLELVNGSDVTKFCIGNVTILPEATR